MLADDILVEKILDHLRRWQCIELQVVCGGNLCPFGHTQYQFVTRLNAIRADQRTADAGEHVRFAFAAEGTSIWFSLFCHEQLLIFEQLSSPHGVLVPAGCHKRSAKR